MQKMKSGMMASMAGLLAAGLRGAPDYYEGGGFRKGPVPNKYTPRSYQAGSTSNASQINALAEKYGKSTVVKQEPDPASITSIKLANYCHRSQARLIKSQQASV